jgi:hypothetical protein
MVWLVENKNANTIETIFWHVNPLLSNDSEINIQEPLLGTAPPTDMSATIPRQQRSGVFYAVRAEML